MPLLPRDFEHAVCLDGPARAEIGRVKDGNGRGWTGIVDEVAEADGIARDRGFRSHRRDGGRGDFRARAGDEQEGKSEDRDEEESCVHDQAPQRNICAVACSISSAAVTTRAFIE